MTSKIKVDNIENQCGGAVVTKCGGTTTISGTVVKSNTLQASDAGNIISQSGTTITLGASGDTINLASGASQSGFGRTGTVDWQTTIKTTGFTAVSGEGYFCNTSSGAFTLTLPASPSAGDIVSLKDYAYTFGSNNLTIGRNGSNIGGGGTDDLTISTNGSALTFIYVDGTKGWLVINESTDTSQGLNPTFITATGGTITTVCTNYKVHTFTGPGTFCVSAAGNPLGSSTVDYMVIAGGGGGGYYGGGGGAGGFRESSGAASGSYSASPLGACVSALPVSVQGYAIAVGGGGPGAAPGNGTGFKGTNSSFSSITSTGGGGGGSGPTSGNAGEPGGSGGASAPAPGAGGGTVGNGNDPSVSPPQGKNGGSSFHLPGVYQLGGGGGGAGAVGNAPPSPGTPSATSAGPGGAGVTSSINGTPTARAGGGGGSSDNGSRPGGTGGTGGGGQGNIPKCGSSQAGTINTGGGGGSDNNGSSQGGGGIVIIRYKFQ